RSVALVVAGLLIGFVAQGWQPAPRAETQGEIIPVEEFSRIIRDFSEEGGYFLSDNFVSNETSYLHVMDKLEEIGTVGEGAYIGVGPEQNFSYIAKLRPRIAFIVDIRRQAIVQQLMYKALFHLSENRIEFLSRLFSSPIMDEAPAVDALLPELLDYFDRKPGEEEVFRKNLSTVVKTIEEDFRFPLTEEDGAGLEYIYSIFWEANLDIRFWFRGRWSWGYFPTLRGILLERELDGDLGNFLAREEDYLFVRELHLQNRIIPVVGDFAGPKALRTVGDYLKKNGYSVSAFYTSNVEQYLFRNGVFGEFVENVRHLPVTEKSLFIRAFTGRGGFHPARVPGHRLTTILQKITTFLGDFDQGRYPNYWALVTTNFISPREANPQK
ncbi:MAG: hypothetical protein IIB03_10705, partial [Acidobacteria bacterium]|nr:hypothetical protein [Acidobacteriota bacterium]